MTNFSPPAWCPDAIPTTRGWVKPNPVGKEGNPELIKSCFISQEVIDEYNKPVKKSKKSKKKAMSEENTNNEMVMLTEAPVGNKPLDEMTEEQREALKETTGSTGESLTE